MVKVASITAGAPDLSVESAEIVRPDQPAGAAPDAPPPPARIAFTVHNAGRNYGYLSSGSLTLVQRDAAGKEMFRRTLGDSDVQQMIGFGLVGPETSRKFIAPIDLERDRKSTRLNSSH